MLVNCNTQFQSFCRSFNPLGVAVIDHDSNLLIDPFNEIHMEYLQVYVPKSSMGDYWVGEVDDQQRPNGAGRYVTQNQVIKTSLCNNTLNGWTEIYQTDDFQELFDGENEKGVFINGKRCGTFVKTALNGSLSYRSYLMDRAFPESFTSQYNGSDWVVTNDMILACQPLLRKELCPIFFDCSFKLTLRGGLSFPREFVLPHGLVETLVFDQCRSNNVVNLVIENCERLKKIEVKNGSFDQSNVMGCFWVAHCPALKSISIRDDGSCANLSSFYLLGLDCIRFVIRRSPKTRKRLFPKQKSSHALAGPAKKLLHAGVPKPAELEIDFTQRIGRSQCCPTLFRRYPKRTGSE